MSSTSRQLHLFDPPRPLVQRLGEGFFRTTPRAPGVYIMTGADERVLYIGQSRNLRARLASYKNARPDRASRKTIRLVRAVASITWEICADAQAARLRENELLRRHRPKFNTINTYPRAYSFITLRCDERELELCRTTRPSQAQSSAPPTVQLPSTRPDNVLDPPPRSDASVYGAFKTGALAAFGALLRLLWSVIHQPRSPHDFPAPLLAAKPRRHYRFSVAESSAFHEHQIPNCLHSFLEGAGDQLLQALGALLPAADSLCPFHRALQNADLETLAGFYRFGPRRNFQLREQHQLSGRLIPQEQLDDLLARASPPA